MGYSRLDDIANKDLGKQTLHTFEVVDKYNKTHIIKAVNEATAKKKVERDLMEQHFKDNPSSTGAKLAAGVFGNPAAGATWGFSDVGLNKIKGYKDAKDEFNFYHPVVGTALDLAGAVATGGLVKKLGLGVGGAILNKLPGVQKALKAITAKASQKAGKVGNFLWDKVVSPDLQAAGHGKLREQGELASGNRDDKMSFKDWRNLMLAAPVAQFAGRTAGKLINAGKGRGELKYKNTKDEIGESVFDTAKKQQVRPIELDDAGVQRTLKHLAADDPAINDSIRRQSAVMKADVPSKVEDTRRALYGKVRDSSKQIEDLDAATQKLYKTINEKWGKKGTISPENYKPIRQRISSETRAEIQKDLHQYTGYKGMPASGFERLRKTAEILQDASDTAFKQGKKHLASDKFEQAKFIKKQLGLEDANLTKADESFATLQKIKEARQKGLSTKGLSEELEGEIATMSSDEQNAFLDGLRRQTDDLIRTSNMGEMSGAINVRNHGFDNNRMAILRHIYGDDAVKLAIKPLDRHINTLRNMDKSLNWSKGDVNAGNEVHGMVRAKKRPENFIAQAADRAIRGANTADPKTLYKILMSPHNQLDSIMGGLQKESGKARSLNRTLGAGAVAGAVSSKPRRVLLKQAAPAVKKLLGMDIM